MRKERFGFVTFLLLIFFLTFLVQPLIASSIKNNQVLKISPQDNWRQSRLLRIPESQQVRGFLYMHAKAISIMGGKS